MLVNKRVHFEKENEMRLSLKKYEAAKEQISKLRIHQKTVTDWEEAMKQVGDVGNQRVVSICIQDGKVTTECEANGHLVKPVEK